MPKTELKKNCGWHRLTASILAGLWAMTPGGLNALPGEGQIVSGTGSITQTAQDMVIQQDTQHLITNWQSFSIGATESVTFKQPSSSAVALNRVIGVDPSLILGKLSSNGQVFLSNPSGVVFGQGAVVDVHGLLATTLSISDKNFLDGNYQFSQDVTKPLAAIINNGVITANRYASLLAPAVQNTGSIIVADLGSVSLGSGTAATLDFNGDGLISFAVSQEVSGTVTDTDGNVINNRINNSGLIRANGGQVRLTVQSARDVIGNVINHTGIIEAQTVQKSNGKIILAGVNTDTTLLDGVASSEVIPSSEYIERPVVETKEGQIIIDGGGQGDVQISGTLDASRVLVSAGSRRNGSGNVTVAAGNSLTTNNGTITIVADDLVLEGDLDAGKGDVFFAPANSGNLTLSADGSMGADIGGDDLSHITARNLVLGTLGNITVKGMNEEGTRGISGSVFMISSGNIIFNTNNSVFKALDLIALNNVNVNANVSTVQGDIKISASDLNLNADLNSGTNDTVFNLATGGTMNLAPGDSRGGFSGEDLSHIFAENLVLKTQGDINVNGITGENTSGINGAVILKSGSDVNFAGSESIFPHLNVMAVNNINVQTNVTTTQSDFIAMADSDNDGKGDFNVAPGVIVTSARDIDVSATNIHAETEGAFEETRDLILNGDIVEEPPLHPEPRLTTVESESIEEGSLGTFLTEFFENGGSGGC